MRVSFSVSGSNKTERSLQNLLKKDLYKAVEQYAKLGVEALSSATPLDSGETASSWDYEIRETRGSLRIQWTNSHVVDGVPIAIILQYGHGTGTGGYVQGEDYINPAIKPVFNKIADSVWKEVKSA